MGWGVDDGLARDRIINVSHHVDNIEREYFGMFVCMWGGGVDDGLARDRIMCHIMWTI